MKLLLDTHVFLWFISGDARLPVVMRESIRDLNNEVYLSVVSLWEAIIKYQLGKLPLPEAPERYLPLQRERHQIASLPLDEVSVVHLASLPALHRDPFDRILMCQALGHGLTIVTVDDLIRAYPVPIFSHT
ncbi:MAG: type II toxin-antitoxin system VapC family toxin [Roseiflexaceae bacterium]|nr:type II toxin-antitoxin system VapC family toxin [Roseiflexus sp.]MDW8215495.1 type II toxin-antitoxin system VapC family toxin [Roseiflexaceae bacterium]